MEYKNSLESARKVDESDGGKAIRIIVQSYPPTQLLGSQIFINGVLTIMIRNSLTHFIKKDKTLLIIENHARYVINEVIKYGVKQLRFYWPKENEFCTIQKIF